MKTSELRGTALDWAVAKAEGVTCAVWQGMAVDAFSNPLMYHDDWALGGPIIEREKISLIWMEFVDEQYWLASIDAVRHEHEMFGGIDLPYEYEVRGDAPLVAAMRCYVASKLGDEVQLPEGLHKT
jgi:hypothetical protein